MGIIFSYKSIDSIELRGWSVSIEDWGSLHYVYIYLPNGNLYSTYPTINLRSAKILVSKHLDVKGIKYIKKQTSF